MALDALLAMLESRVVSPVTASKNDDVTPQPAPMLARTPVTSVTAANGVTAEPLPDQQAESRRQRVLEILETNRSARFALVTDTDSDPEAVILALVIRERASCEIRIPRTKYDGFLLLDLIEKHFGTIH